MFILEEEIIATKLENGVIRKIKGYINELMVVELEWQKGMVGDVHAHPHCQCGYIIKGKFEANVNETKQILKAGDCFYATQNVPHGLVCLEDDSLMIDIFTPMRKDFIE